MQDATKVAAEAARPSRRGLAAGVLAALPMLIVVVPFGLLFGAVSREAGLDLLATVVFSALVAAGAAQLVALQMVGEHAPVIVAVLAGAAVNLRMAMYSAAIAPHWEGTGMRLRALAAYFLHDQSYGLSIRRYAERPEESLADRLGFFFGIGGFTLVFWNLSAFAGALIGAGLPPGWGLEVAVPVCFLAIAAPAIRGLSNIVAASVGVVLALLCAGLPWNLGVMVAAAGGIAAGTAVALRRGR